MDRSPDLPMHPTPTIRPERQHDHEVIRSIIERAFDGMPYADGDEAELIETLRSQGALAISLVAELDGAVVGQIAFSRATSSDSEAVWYALGPVAVLPEHQGTGIGSRLVRAGLRLLGDSGAAGCILTGNPDYYTRFGFEVSPTNAPPGEPAEFFMIKVLQGPHPLGSIAFHSAFQSSA